MTDEILKRLDLLAAKLGTTGEKIWDILVRQARVEWITDAVVGLVFAGLTAYLVWWTLRFFEKDKTEDHAGYIAVCFVGFIVTGVVALIYLSSIPTPLLNPQFWALQQILENLKK